LARNEVIGVRKVVTTKEGFILNKSNWMNHLRGLNPVFLAAFFAALSFAFSSAYNKI
jgi:hypothetical protein